MALVNCRLKRAKAIAVIIGGACVIASVFDGYTLLFSAEDDDGGSRTLSLRRGLLASGDRRIDRDRRHIKAQVEDEIDPFEQEVEGAIGGGDSVPFMYPWAQANLLPNTGTPDPVNETVLFWHIPKSGGSTVKAIYKCFLLNNRVLSTPSLIFEAEKLGLVASGQVDMFISPYPKRAIQHLFDPSHKGRAMVMLRHPVDRLVSKFYYLQIADWEKTYRPDWKNMDILEWAQSQNFDNNHMVRKLAGKTQFDGPNELDLELAKRTVKDRFIVGLMNEFEESIHRFNAVMGIDESEKQGKCMKRFFVKGKKSNSNPHPKVELGSPAWELLAQMNALDIKLYEYAVRLFEEQKMLFVNSRDDVEKGRRPVNAISGADDAKRLSARIKREEARRLKREQRYAASLARPK